MVPDHDQLAQPEALAHGAHGLAAGGRIGGVARKHPHRDRSPGPLSAHPESALKLASLADPGSTTRETINAKARSRCRPAGPSSAGNPSARAWAHTAATCPWGNERATDAAVCAGTSCTPLSPASIQSITCGGNTDRLATVSFLTLPPSR